MSRSSTSPMSERAEVLARFTNVRRTTEWICEPLEIEDYVIQTSTECSPVKWQLGHTTWFFETFLLKPFVGGYQDYHEKFSFLFNSYYNSIGDRLARTIRGLISRPTVLEIRDYRNAIDRAMTKLIEDSSETEWKRIAPLILLGVNHEQQHQELILTDVKTVYALNSLDPVYRNREILSTSVRDLMWKSLGGGLFEFGAIGDSFCFDNEGPRHKQYLEEFQLADRLITNGEYKEFMRDGGYANPLLWLSEGWATANIEQWKAPKYWEKRNDEWCNFTFQGIRPVEDSEPVTHISHFEADAFATWYGARLPTEFEWEHASKSVTTHAGNFLEHSNFHPTPDSEGTITDQPIRQLFGDTWEWTRSAYLPYPGYAPTRDALGEYNGKFMSNQMVLRGGSCATPQDHIRSTYRNFFPSGSRWQFSGIRLAK